MSNKLIILTLSSLFLLSGCLFENKNLEDVNQLILDKKSTGYSVANKISELNKYTPVNYEAFDKKSPFEEYFNENILKSREDSIKPDLEREKEYLEKFELTQLRITGIIDNKKERKAIIFDGERNHILGIDNYIGNNFGQIKIIESGTITIEEIVKEDGINSWVKKEVMLSLKNNKNNNEENN
jgi:type IV pilus assembly protein PilP